MNHSKLQAARQGTVTVPGAELSYRLSGTVGAPLLVFENGWGASYEQWMWVERQLAPHAQLLFYNRAGIGGSRSLVPQTVQGLSDQFAALLDALGLGKPVIAVGHSYGGLICSLHAAQRRDVLRTVIEIDSTPELPDLDKDSSLDLLPKIVGVTKFLLKLGLPNLVFSQVGKFLPPEETRTLMEKSLSNPVSLDAGLAELALLPEIRAAIAAGRPRNFPRLFIAAGRMPLIESALERILGNPKKNRALFARKVELQRSHAAKDDGCRLLSLNHDHGGLVFAEDGARDTSSALLDFAQQRFSST